MTGLSREAARLRECRVVFERALADGISVAAARERITYERCAEIEARLEDRRAGRVQSRTSERPEQWWQRL